MIAWTRSYARSVLRTCGAVGTVRTDERASSPEAIREHASRAGPLADEIIPIADGSVVVWLDPVAAGDRARPARWRPWRASRPGPYGRTVIVSRDGRLGPYATTRQAPACADRRGLPQPAALSPQLLRAPAGYRVADRRPGERRVARGLLDHSRSQPDRARRTSAPTSPARQRQPHLPVARRAQGCTGEAPAPAQRRPGGPASSAWWETGGDPSSSSSSPPARSIDGPATLNVTAAPTPVFRRWQPGPPVPCTS